MKLTLTKQILLGVAIGIAVGHFFPQFGTQIGWLRDIFLHLIKAIIAPLVFATVVVGIAGGGSAKKLGMMGANSIFYFEVTKKTENLSYCTYADRFVGHGSKRMMQHSYG